MGRLIDKRRDGGKASSALSSVVARADAQDRGADFVEVERNGEAATLQNRMARGEGGMHRVLLSCCGEGAKTGTQVRTDKT